jgi:excisionase family DNA binding protein
LERILAERAGQSSRPSHSQRKPKVLLPDPGATLAHGGAGEGPASEGASGGEKRAPIASVAPTLADLRVLWGGRDRLLRVAEVAEHLGVGVWRIYQLCEDGELPHVRINNSIRVRPKDLEEFIAARVTIPEKRRPHRRKTSE